ncbi:glycosyltransferase [Sphingomonas sp.]|jgi:hypothetical protein|uniref:glycosyltransferase n=1 Tax=Sphingomonas sp. TaxID=28214 RepID=UPI00262E59CF|nr:glycosyltransferase [Sphingomonas sp.]MDF2604942.1 glycosyltransferase [Sphingomonas sp.]
MTRVLRIITSADPRAGGPIEGARRLGEVWARQGHRQDLLTLDPPDEFHLPDYPGAIVPLGPPRGRDPRQLYRYSPAMVPWLQRHARGYDAVIVSGLWRYGARGAARRRRWPAGRCPISSFRMACSTHGFAGRCRSSISASS